MRIDMKAKNPLKPLLAVLVGSCLATLAACTGVQTHSSNVPDGLDAGGSVRVLSTISATGVQIYECRSTSVGVAPAWAFVGPEAQLFDARGRSAGSHGAGPYWMALDGSRVVGSVRARADAPSSSAIPWLLLATQNVGGPGVLSAVTFIQRLNTEGGLAPAMGCDAQSIGRQARVGYRADYRLFVPA
jgi:Protein of unknown function (DUF3455)